MSQVQADVVWDSPYQSKITTQIEAPGIRVFWWNIQGGQTKKMLMRESVNGGGSLDLNLLEVAQSTESPDIIVLGEYSADTLDELTLKKLKQLYPYSPQDFWPYSPDTPEGGLMLFSRFPFTIEREELLDYFPLEMVHPKEIEAYKKEWAKDFPPERFFPRTYLNIKIDHPLGQFNLVPFHALVHMEKELQHSDGSYFSILKIKLKVAFGSENPLMYQFKRLRKALEQDFGEELNRLPFVIIGDFNMLRKVLGFFSRPYRVISDGLTDLFLDNDFPTWPLPSSKEFQEYSMRMQIDHAFASPRFEVLETAILPLRGSDHAAISVKLRLKNNQIHRPEND